MDKTLNLPKVMKAFLLTLLLSGAGLGSLARAAEFTVVMTDYYRFNPSYQEIEVNDVVTWVNRDNFDAHSSVSTDGYWDSGDLDYGDTFSLQFLAPGTYDYVDYFYWVLGMTGTIVVKPATEPTPLMLIAPMRLQDGRFQFTVSNLTAGATYIIEGSTNFVNWTNLGTNVAASSVETWTDEGAADFKRRFYRAQQLQ
jgi:plastocyanin